MGKLNADGTRIIQRGEGVYIWDSQGKRYLDGFAGLWCVNVGYGRKEIADAVARQMNELPYYNTFFGTTTTPTTLLAEKVTSHAGHGSTTSFSPVPARRQTTHGSGWRASIGAPIGKPSKKISSLLARTATPARRLRALVSAA